MVWLGGRSVVEALEADDTHAQRTGTTWGKWGEKSYECRDTNWCTRDYKLSVWDSPVESAIRAFSNRNHLCSLLNLS